jgi:dTDP-4-dehydrorhamnose reductase
MKIMFTGISGLIGRYVFEDSEESTGHSLFGTSRIARPSGVFERLSRYEAMPFQNRDGYSDLIDSFRPDVIVHAGGEGNVDLVEQDPETARKTNLDFPLFLLEKASRLKARFVQFSSNAVYDGQNAPYSETSPAAPVHQYGKMKVAVDQETRRFKGEWMILRPIVAYGWNFPFGRANPVSQFVPLLQEGRNLKMVDDVYENPVYAGDVARVLWKCLKAGFHGELNVGGGDQGVNRYEWVQTMAEVFELDASKVTPVSLDSFKSMAPRPKDTRFNISKLLKELKYRPLTVREGAEAMKRDRARWHLGT